MYLVTGAAGFIGCHVAAALLARGDQVIGLDNLNSYYDPALKQARLALLHKHEAFRFHLTDIADRDAVTALIAQNPGITHIIHLAAQAGVRFSMTDPYAYVHSNVMGHVVMLEAARRLPALKHVVYASSSSVYGLNRSLPFRETDRVDTPTSVYAATKRADELLSHAYSHLYRLPQTGLRFFTVYGPWGRPDMAYYSFADAIMAKTPITLYDGGRLQRDFTYIDDIVAGVLGVAARPPPADQPRLLNIGNHRSECVSLLVELLERELGRPATIRIAPRPPADVATTWAAVDDIGALTGYAPETTLEQGIPRFAAWYKSYHQRA